MTKSNIILRYIDDCCDCDYEFFRMMMTRYMSKTKSFLLEIEAFIKSEISHFYDFFISNVINNCGSNDF